jgi:hypothetical protein
MRWLGSGALLLAACSGRVEVTSSANDGEGTLRAALHAAAANPRVGRIRVQRGLASVRLASPLVYPGSHPLRIEGRGLVLDGTALTDTALAGSNAVFVATGGADLVLQEVVVRGAAGSGIIVAVPASRTGRVSLALEGVTVEDNGHHGVLVNDQAHYFAAPLGADSAGSVASIVLRVTGSRFLRNGRGGLDYDGLRVNEGGPGSLEVVISTSHADQNGGDGIELDERGEGSAAVAIDRSTALANGFHSPADLDDGIDVDEYGPGDLRVRLVDVTASLNAQKGVDLTEAGDGALSDTRVRVTAEGNPDD